MEKIITQAAKYKLYLMLAQQQIGQGTTREIRDAILNVSVLIGGRNAPTFYGPVASMLNVSPEAIGELDRGEFIAHLSGMPPLPFQIHTHLLDFKHRMSEREWQGVRAEQLRRYYRPIAAPPPPVPAVPEMMPPERAVPYRPRQEVIPPSRQEVIPTSGVVRRKRTIKADPVEITEEEEGIL
jgi:hypothetical protein